MSVDRRLLAGSLAAALVISIGGGYLVSRQNDAPAADDELILDTPGEAQIPSIATNQLVVGTPLPETDLEDGDGNRIVTSELLGQPLIINVWNSFCAPCKRELPALAAAHADLGDRIRFVGVNNLDTAVVNESFARDRGVGYELLRDLDDSFASEVGIATLPVTLFVTADGIVVHQTGVLEEDELRELATELLG